MTFEPEFKKALHLLSDADKDKLILRLLKHDLNLANQLLFELVATDSVEDRREKLKERIMYLHCSTNILNFNTHTKTTSRPAHRI